MHKTKMEMWARRAMELLAWRATQYVDKMCIEACNERYAAIQKRWPV